jgi:hypothetical protein
VILFPSDWAKYPNAIIDTQTANKSAVNLALKYRKMGIENHAFFLALHDASLQGVDPYSKDLTVHQMVAIGVECKKNPWYFFREVARAPAIAGTNASMVEFNRANISLWWCFFNHITYILIQPRQTGKSFCTDLLMTELYNFHCANTQINLLTKDDKLRGENVKRLKNIYEELPVYLNLKTKEDANNTEEITIKALNNTYITHVPQMSPKRAYNLGRGLTTPIMHIDEAPFQPNIGIAMQSSLGAMGAAIEAAQRNGEPYGVILTTTAGKKDDKDGKFVYAYADESAKWSEKFFDAINAAGLEKMIRRNSRKGVCRIYGSFSYKQLGKSDAWLRSQLERTSGSPDESNRDFFNIWTSGTQHAPLPTHILEKLTASIVSEQAQSISAIGGYITRWYIPEDQIEQYMRERKTVIGIDTSDAVGQDGISFVMTDVETGEIVAVGEFNETNLITFAQWLVWFLVNYLQCTMIIERRSSGATIIDYLLAFLPLHGIDPFTRLFNWVVNDHYEHKDRYEETKATLGRRSDDLYVRAKKYFGFATSGSGETSRTELYSTTLQNAAKRCADKVKDRSLTEQITGLVTRNGRIDHDVGGHDDLVIGWLLCHWFLTMAKNLSHYGIDSRFILVDHKPKVELNASQAFFEKEQNTIRDRISELFKKLSEERDQFIVERHERELRHLDSRIVLKDNEFFSIDALLNEAKQDRKNARYENQGYQHRSFHEKLGYAKYTGVTVDGLGSSPLVRF